MKIFKLSESSSNSSSTKEDSMNNSRLLIKSERETLPPYIWSKSTKIKTDTQLRPSQKKQLTVKKKENNASSSKLKS